MRYRLILGVRIETALTIERSKLPKKIASYKAKTWSYPPKNKQLPTRELTKLTVNDEESGIPGPPTPGVKPFGV